MNHLVLPMMCMKITLMILNFMVLIQKCNNKLKGKIIVTKDVEGCIKCWIFDRDSDSILFLNIFNYPINQRIWYIKFDILP